MRAWFSTLQLVHSPIHPRSVLVIYWPVKDLDCVNVQYQLRATKLYRRDVRTWSTQEKPQSRPLPQPEVDLMPIVLSRRRALRSPSVLRFCRMRLLSPSWGKYKLQHFTRVPCKRSANLVRNICYWPLLRSENTMRTSHDNPRWNHPKWAWPWLGSLLGHLGIPFRPFRPWWPKCPCCGSLEYCEWAQHDIGLW